MDRKDRQVGVVKASSDMRTDNRNEEVTARECRVQALEAAYEDDAMRAMGYIQSFGE